METTQRFTTDAKAVAYLRKIKRAHLSARMQNVGPKPKRADFGKRFGSYMYQNALKKWKDSIKSVGLKAVIEHN